MIEQLFFITISIVLFGLMFLKMIKRNDTEYLVIILLEAIGIIIDGVGIIFNFKTSKILMYMLSIIVPVVILILENKNINIIEQIKFTRIKLYLSLGDNKKAKDLLLNIIEKNPNDYNSHKYLARIYEKEGGRRKSIDEYVICIEINKKDYDSYYKVAILLNELEKKEEAIQMLSNLLDKKPDYYNATLALGDLLIENENYKEAAVMYNEALKYNPLSFEINYGLGITYTMLNDFQSAKEYYEKAAEINSLNYYCKYNLAEIALLYKELDLAEEYFSKTLESDVLQADSYYELAKINLMKGRKEIAIKYANIAVDIESKRISEKIKKEPLFIPIIAKISIPFNLEEKVETRLEIKEKKAKEHLEDTSNITMNMGYINLKLKKENDKKIDIPRERGE